jgi:hypothetical protein
MMDWKWLTNLIPVVGPIVGALAGMAGANKATKAAKLPTEMEQAQTQAMQLANQRMLLTNPLYERLVQGATNRLANSAQPGYQAQGGYPAMPRRSPGMGQAMSRLAQNLPPPGARQVRGARKRPAQTDGRM